jgi:hypothetical protein
VRYSGTIFVITGEVDPNEVDLSLATLSLNDTLFHRVFFLISDDVRIFPGIRE